jgi:hypothetical protein
MTVKRVKTLQKPGTKLPKVSKPIKTAYTDKSLEWDSGLNIITDPKISIDHTLLTVCDEIQKAFPGEEFSILAKGEYTEKGFTVFNDYIIPKQKVSGSAVDYLDELWRYSREGYNVAIHSHHNMGTFFSNTDHEDLNPYFPCSILYNKEGFKLAHLSFSTKGHIFLMESTKINTILGEDDTLVTLLSKKGSKTFVVKTDALGSISDQEELIIQGIENIEKKTYYYANNAYYSKFCQNQNQVDEVINKTYGKFNKKNDEEYDESTYAKEELLEEIEDTYHPKVIPDEYCKECHIAPFDIEKEGCKWCYESYNEED